VQLADYAEKAAADGHGDGGILKLKMKFNFNMDSLNRALEVRNPAGTIDFDGNFDLCVIGAGPTGMACAIEAQRAGFRVVLIEKGCLVNSSFTYPANMVFFTTPRAARDRRYPVFDRSSEAQSSGSTGYYRNVAQPTSSMFANTSG